MDGTTRSHTSLIPPHFSLKSSKAILHNKLGIGALGALNHIAITGLKKEVERERGMEEANMGGVGVAEGGQRYLHFSISTLKLLAEIVGIINSNRKW